jgi:signal peptidase I
MAGPRRTEALRHRLRGPWRVAIQQASMEPTIREGDWLLVDPTTTRWPRRGSIVAFHEPDTGALAVKRVAGTPGDRVPFRDGYLELADDEAWLVADADPATAAAAGHGEPIDSNRFGPVPVELLVGRVWFRYAPLGRVGPVRRRPVPDAPVPD